jgi:LmbE family N-acetylglucosaminyl deacetylase
MFKVGFKPDTRTVKILCLGAHCDDIEIGCGGTLLKFIDQCRSVEFHWVVFTSISERKVEALASAELFLKNVREKKIVIESFRDGFLPYYGERIKEYFETLKNQFSPDVIFTHYRNDLHQDHRLICELTWNTFRNHLILEYEIPKYDGDLGMPNIFVHLQESHYQEKIKNILKSYTSQNVKAWFTEDTFLALMRIRGVESCSQTGYAEAFHCRKLCLE